MIGLTGRRVATAAAVLTAAAFAAVTGASAASTTTISFAESGLGTEGQQTAKAITGVREGQPVDQGHDRRALARTRPPTCSSCSSASSPARARPTCSSPTSPIRRSSRRPVGSSRSRRFHPNMKPVLPDRGRRRHLQGRALRDPVVRQPGGPLLPDRPDQDAADQSRRRSSRDAQAAMKKDKSLKEGLAFEGAKYEGAITAFMTVDGAVRRQADAATASTRRATSPR